jgi:hypothetical protein
VNRPRGVAPGSCCARARPRTATLAVIPLDDAPPLQRRLVGLPVARGHQDPLDGQLKQDVPVECREPGSAELAEKRRFGDEPRTSLEGDLTASTMAVIDGGVQGISRVAQQIATLRRTREHVQRQATAQCACTVGWTRGLPSARMVAMPRVTITDGMLAVPVKPRLASSWVTLDPRMAGALDPLPHVLADTVHCDGSAEGAGWRELFRRATTARCAGSIVAAS